MVAATHNDNVLNNLGSFASLYRLGEYQDPVLVSGTDGVGTKLKLAFASQIYDTVGIDLVAMCVNDVLCHGARPLFFLDYLACSHLDPEVSAQLVAGITEGCRQANAALVGGETAEMPGFYAAGEYDMAGFCVGVVERAEIIDGSEITAKDKLIALPSSGVHSNGYSLIRRLFDENDFPAELLTPTRIYVSDVIRLLDAGIRPHGLAHITGGGLIENVPRMMPQGLSAVIEKAAIQTPDVYRLPQFQQVPVAEMWGTFNMGVGFVLAVAEADADKVLELIPAAYMVGEVMPDEYLSEVDEAARTGAAGSINEHTVATSTGSFSARTEGLWLR